MKQTALLASPVYTEQAGGGEKDKKRSQNWAGGLSSLHVLWVGMLSCLKREENGNSLQYSCLENLVDRGAWWAAVRGVAQSRT